VYQKLELGALTHAIKNDASAKDDTNNVED